MGWLLGPGLIAGIGALVIVHVLSGLLSNVNHAAVVVAKPGISVAVWTAVVWKAGTHGFASKVRGLRQRNSQVRAALTKGEGQG